MEAIIQTPVKKSGVLQKLGGGGGGHKNWKDRFLVLREHLSYYDTRKSYEKQEKPRGIISLNSYYCSIVEGSSQHEFAIYSYPKSLVLRATDEDELREWVDAIMLAKDDTEMKVTEYRKQRDAKMGFDADEFRNLLMNSATKTA